MTPRKRCAKLLQEVLQSRFPGIKVNPSDLWSRRGGEYKLDIARWGASIKWVHTLSLYSWDTMTECARLGIIISGDDLEISAREPECKANRCPVVMRVHGILNGDGEKTSQ